MNKTPEEIYDKIKGVVITGEYIDDNDNKVEFNFKEWFLNEITEFGNQQYNQGVLDCVENGRAYSYLDKHSDGTPCCKIEAIIDKELLLKLLKP